MLRTHDRPLLPTSRAAPAPVESHRYLPGRSTGCGSAEASIHAAPIALHAGATPTARSHASDDRGETRPDVDWTASVTALLPTTGAHTVGRVQYWAILDDASHLFQRGLRRGDR